MSDVATRLRTHKYAGIGCTLDRKSTARLSEMMDAHREDSIVRGSAEDRLIAKRLTDKVEEEVQRRTRVMHWWLTGSLALNALALWAIFEAYVAPLI